jgi:hypothetical protein
MLIGTKITWNWKCLCIFIEKEYVSTSHWTNGGTEYTWSELQVIDLTVLIYILLIALSVAGIIWTLKTF